MNLPMRNGQISRYRSSLYHGTFTDCVGGGRPALMYSSSADETRGCCSGGLNIFCQNTSQIRPSTPMNTNADCQPQVVAITTMPPETITPTLVPELNMPVA